MPASYSTHLRRRDFLAIAGTALGTGLLPRTSAIAADDDEKPVGPRAKSLTAPALCVAPDRRAAEAGAAMLRRGGNAFDAAVAAGFVEAVVAPQSCGIGGYGATGIAFHAKSQKCVAIDANAVAPRAATPAMFPVIPDRDSKTYKLPDDKHKHGPLSVAVPGVLAGLCTLLERWGTLDRQTVMAPAIRFARDGIALAPAMARTWLTIEAEAEGRAPPGPEDVPKRLPMDDLATTLDAIAAEGPDIFYAGRIGHAIAEHVSRGGGILTTDDMAAYRPLLVEPLSVEVRGQTLFTPPPGAGGLTSLQMVALFDRLCQRDRVPETGSPDAFEFLLEIDKVVWEERLRQLADPRFMAHPPETLLSDSHLDELLERVKKGLADPKPGRLIAPDPLKGTVHLAAADAEGNIVAWTQTHGGGFGAGVMVPKTGIVLGHGMCRFEPRLGWANSVAPGKRPLHNMSPIIALRQGRPVLAVGAAGGRTIVNNSASLAIGRLIHGLGAVETMAAPRLQCESLEPAVIEKAAGPECVTALRARGHALKEAAKDAGTAQLIARDGNSWIGVAESRAPTAAVAAGAG
ncbi:MAG: gamma-glutamyltransferase [Planctomycetia bacterium]|nr:gamma-glutamyltransferase [Planctomycetia bacterium]